MRRTTLMSVDKGKRKTTDECEGQSAKRRPSPERDEVAEDDDTPAARTCRARGCSYMYLESIRSVGSDNCSLMLHSDPDYLLSWSRAFLHYRSALMDSKVEIVWSYLARSDSRKTIVNVAFRSLCDKDRDHESKTYSFNSARGAEKILVPEQMVSMPEEDRQCLERISKTVLAKERFERISGWVECNMPDVRGLCPWEDNKGLTVPEFWKLGKKVVHEEGRSAESKVEMMKTLLKAGEAAYESRTAMVVQDAFVEEMKDSPGKEGVRTLLEHLCNIADGDKLRVRCHDGSDDEYGVNFDLIPYKLPVRDLGKSAKNNISGGGGTSDEEIDDIKDNGSCRLPRQGSVSPTSCRQNRSRSSSPNSSIRRSCLERTPCTRTCHADLTVFVRQGSRALPLLVVEILSTPADDTFHMQELLLGGLLFRDEIFGLHINPLFAKIYRMKKDNSLKNIFYTYQTYEFDHAAMDQIEWDSNEFCKMCEDLFEVFKYGLGASALKLLQSNEKLVNSNRIKQ